MFPKEFLDRSAEEVDAWLREVPGQRQLTYRYGPGCRQVQVELRDWSTAPALGTTGCWDTYRESLAVAWRHMKECRARLVPIKCAACGGSEPCDCMDPGV